MRDLAFVIKGTWVLDRIPRVGVTLKLVPLKVTLGDDLPSGHFSYMNLRLVTSLAAMITVCFLRDVTATL
jgi:hypothetical protein